MASNIVSAASVSIALLALGIALWQGTLARRQVAHNENLNRAKLHQGIAKLFIEVDKFLVDNADLRPYFYGNRPTPTGEKQRDKVVAMAEMFADLAEYCTATEIVRPELAGDWDRYFQHLYTNSPTLREYWANYRDYYPDRVKKSFRISGASSG